MNTASSLEVIIIIKEGISNWLGWIDLLIFGVTKLLLLLFPLALFTIGCGENKEDTTSSKLGEDITEVEPQLDGVTLDKLEEREGIVYLKGSDTPYTGKATSLYENGQKTEANLKDGKRDGLIVLWHENGQKALEQKYKDGEEISAKYWNRKGEPVDSFEEAEKK